MINITPIPAFNDNYLWLLADQSSRQAVVVDPGDAEAVKQALAEQSLELSAILVTHHHYDHTDGIAELVKDNDIPVYGPSNSKIRQITHPLIEGDEILLFNNRFQILEVPGHTLDHIAYYCPELKALFCGDTLFAAGCGRLFEGNPAMMSSSLKKLAKLPADTQVFCAHEYTLANLDFALAVEPSNPEILARQQRDRHSRDLNKPTLPSTIALENKTNPFLRCNEMNVQQSAQQHSGKPVANPVEVFAILRQWKDNF